ncbi:MAG: NOL1/NOP2/sun family putative RNA methylase [Melioribacteraceae bacterium]|nr:NOL1/NOP2/sun family putative RNA methylase [Melioribacteraceae bacterium]
MIELSQNISDYILKTFGEEFLNNFRSYIEQDAEIYLRLPLNFDERKTIIPKLASYGVELEQHKSIPFAYKVLSGYEKLGKTLEYTIGKYYIQSLSSMIPPIVLDAGKNNVTLDMCAAPGSKSTQIAEMMNNTGTFYANEPSPKRIKSLVYNLDRLNIVNMGVSQKQGEILSKHFNHYFDKILVDAPCSGLGIVQKRGEISNWWNEDSVSRISDTQMRLLVSAVKSAKVGGEIVYSTCTLTVEENELILNTVLKRYPVELVDIGLPVKSHQAFTEYKGAQLNPQIAKARRIIPWEINSEGFFIAKLVKTGTTEVPAKISTGETKLRIINSKHKDIRHHLQNLSEYYGISLEVFDNFRFIMKSRDINYINANWQSDDLSLYSRIGTKFGTVDNRGNIVLNSLAIQSFKEHITQNIIELTTTDELKTYMTGGIIKGITNQAGYKVIKYNGYFLGTAVGTKEGLKSQYPRAMRTHEILIN